VFETFHEHGMIHNDLTPNTIAVLMVGGDVDVRLIDKGSARAWAEMDADMPGGTIAYRSPRNRHEPLFTRDMWSAGCCMIEMISASHESMFWYDDSETIGIHEFAMCVIVNDLLRLYGSQVPMYVIGYTAEIDVGVFERASVLGSHAPVVFEQLRRVRDAYRANLVSLSHRLDFNVAQERLKFRESVSGIILSMFVLKKKRADA
jgi:serine/threonine protein kinase